MADPGARLARPAARAASLSMEEREVGARPDAARRGCPRLLGAERLPHARRPVDRRKIRGAGTDAARYQQIEKCQQKDVRAKNVSLRLLLTQSSYAFLPSSS